MFRSIALHWLYALDMANYHTHDIWNERFILIEIRSEEYIYVYVRGGGGGGGGVGGGHSD